MRYFSNPSSESVFVIEGNLDRLLRRLHQGMILRCRIVLKITNRKYLLRIYGYNMVMESNLNFNRFDEIDIKVEQVYPKLKLSPVAQKRSNNQESVQHRTDLII